MIAHAATLDAGPGAKFSSASTRSEDGHSADVVRMKDVENGGRRYSSDSCSPRSSHEMDAKDKKRRVVSTHASTLDKGTKVQDRMDTANLEKEDGDADEDLAATGRGGKDVEVEQMRDNHIVGNSCITGETKVLVAC